MGKTAEILVKADFYMMEEERKNRRLYLEEIHERNARSHHATCFLEGPGRDNLTKNVKKY